MYYMRINIIIFLRGVCGFYVEKFVFYLYVCEVGYDRLWVKDFIMMNKF